MKPLSPRRLSAEMLQPPRPRATRIEILATLALFALSAAVVIGTVIWCWP